MGQAGDRLLNLQRGVDGKFGILFMRGGIAEIGQHPIAHIAGNKAARCFDPGGASLQEADKNISRFFGAERGNHFSRADQVDKHNCQLTSLHSAKSERNQRDRTGFALIRHFN